MPNALHSEASRALANVRLQLKSGKTRGATPRDLTPAEIQALEERRDQLEADLIEARRKRVADRVNAHTTKEAEQTRVVVSAEG